MKSVQRVSSNRSLGKDAETIVAKILEFEIMDRAWFQILRIHPELHIDSDGKPLEFERNCRIHCAQRRLRNIELHHPVSALVRSIDTLVGVDAYGSLRAFDERNELHELTSLDLLQLHVDRSHLTATLPGDVAGPDYDYTPTTHFRILAHQHFSAAAYSVANNHFGTVPTSIPACEAYCHSRYVLCNIVVRSLKPPFEPEAGAAPATKKSAAGKKGAMEAPPEKKLFYRVLVVDLCVHTAEEEEDAGFSWRVVHELLLDCELSAEHAVIAVPPMPVAETEDAAATDSNSVSTPLSPEDLAAAGRKSDELLRKMLLCGINADLSANGRLLSLISSGEGFHYGCKLFDLAALSSPTETNSAAVATAPSVEQGNNAGAELNTGVGEASEEQGDGVEGAVDNCPVSSGMKLAQPPLVAIIQHDSTLLAGSRLKRVLILPDHNGTEDSLDSNAVEAGPAGEVAGGTIDKNEPAHSSTQSPPTAAAAAADDPHEAAIAEATQKVTNGKRYSQLTLLVLLQNSPRWLVLGFRAKSVTELLSSAAPASDSAQTGKAKPAGRGQPVTAAAPVETVALDVCLLSEWTLPATITAHALETSARSLLALGLRDGSVSLWDVARRRLIDTVGRHHAQVTSLSLQRGPAAPNRDVSLVSGALDGTLCFYAPNVSVPSAAAPTTHQCQRRPRAASSSITLKPAIGSAAVGDATEQLLHLQLQDYRNDVHQAAVLQIVREDCTADPHAVLSPIVFVQYSNGALVAYDSSGTLQSSKQPCFLIGRLQKKERADFQDVVSHFSTITNLPTFQDPVKIAAAAEAAAAIAVAKAEAEAEAIAAAAAEAALNQDADAAAESQPDAGAAAGTAATAAHVDECEGSLGMDSAGELHDEAASQQQQATPEPATEEEQIDLMPYDQVHVDLEAYSNSDEQLRLLGLQSICTASSGCFVASCLRNGAPFLAVYSVEHLLQQVPSAAERQGGEDLAILNDDNKMRDPAGTIAMTTLDASNPTTVNDRRSHHQQQQQQQQQQHQQLRLTEERLAALEDSFLTHEQRLQKQTMSRNSTYSSAQMAGTLPCAMHHTTHYPSRRALMQTEVLRSKYERNARKAKLQTTALDLGNILQ